MDNNKSVQPTIFERFQQISPEINISNLSPEDVIRLSELGIDPSKLRMTSKGGRPYRLSLEEELLVCKLLEAGCSIASVAEQFNLSKQTTKNIRDRHLKAQ